MFQMPKRHSKKDVGKDVEIPLIREKYRGFGLACYGCAELVLARRNVDRIWARKIYDAPNAAARAGVLAEERQLMEAASPSTRNRAAHRNRRSGLPNKFAIDPGETGSIQLDDKARENSASF